MSSGGRKDTVGTREESVSSIGVGISGLKLLNDRGGNVIRKRVTWRVRRRRARAASGLTVLGSCECVKFRCLIAFLSWIDESNDYLIALS